MSSVRTEPQNQKHEETPSAVLLRLWDDIEQTLAAQPQATHTQKRLRTGAVTSPHTETSIEETPARVRYAFD
jgi:hypothetical protein